jgi:O-acetyl-ADP-ribose deacetylase (regulator of RNase III)
MSALEFSRKIRNTTVQVKMGDLSQEQTEAIVNPANSTLSMEGGVAAAIKLAGGEEIELEAVKQAPCPVGQAIYTKGGALPAKFVIHSPTMTRPGTRINPSSVKRAIEAALGLAKELRLATISIPGMGTGVGGVSYKDATRVMIEAIRNHVNSGTTLTEIHLVARDKLLFEALREEISAL